MTGTLIARVLFCLSEEENKSLKAQVAQLSTSQSSTSSEVETFKRRADEVEREKRDLMGVISRMKEEGAHREGTCLCLSVLLCASETVCL